MHYYGVGRVIWEIFSVLLCGYYGVTGGFMCVAMQVIAWVLCVFLCVAMGLLACSRRFFMRCYAVTRV